MDFNVTSSRQKPSTSKSVVVLGASSTGAAPTLSLYDTPPIHEVALEEFERHALDRLNVLRGIEEAKSRGKRQDDMDLVVNELWRKHMRMPNAVDGTRKDLVSHFVLRLAFCRTEELRRWFLSAECSLFRSRFRSETADAQRRYMEASKLPYRAITAPEFEAVREKLTQVARSMNLSPPGSDSMYYRVPFEEVPELVATRRVYLHKGSAFVPRDQLASLVVGHFRATLSKALVLTKREWTTRIGPEESDRLLPVVESLSIRYLGPDFSQVGESKGVVQLQTLDELARRSFPLCMRHLFFKLREEHHLRHGGRQQLGLFLKGIGLKLEDALAFWRAEFSRKVGGEKFDKEYAYGIRHNFGKEGKRTDYTPYSCMKVINMTPGVGDHHGCPFRHFSEENLRAALMGLQLSAKHTDDVMGKVRNHHYQLACGMTFEGTHGCSCDTGINHPNSYFDQSRKVINGPDVEAPSGGESPTATATATGAALPHTDASTVNPHSA